MNIKDRVQWVYDSKSNEELAERYNEWSDSYEQSLSNYTAPQEIITYFTKYVNHQARVLDAGAGTGVVGQTLQQQGYQHLVALDLSAGMLAKAEQKKIYSELHQGILGEPLQFPTNSFDAAISVGVFTLGHAPVTAFDELIRIIKPSGYMIFSLNAILYDDFEAALSAFEVAGRWQLIEISEKFYPLVDEPEFTMQALVYQIKI